MCSAENSTTTEEKIKTMVINDCNVTLKFSDKPLPKIENAIMDILMSAFEARIRKQSGHKG